MTTSTSIAEWSRPASVLTRCVLYLLTTVLLVVCWYCVRLNWSLGALHPSPVSGAMPEEDLASLWMAGHLARLGHLDWLYTAPLYEAWRHRMFGPTLGPLPWIYPPTVLLLGVPLSWLPLPAAFLLWDAGTLLAAVLVLRRAGLPWPILLLGLAAPASWRSLVLGQYGVIAGALVVAGTLISPRRPVRAGIMLGLCTLKPQQGMILPVAWLAARNWRAIAAAACVAVALALLVAGWLGAGSWQLFLTQGTRSMHALVEAAPPTGYINSGVSVFWAARTLGAGVAPAYVLQGMAALAAIVFAYRAWRRPEADPLARMAVTVSLSLLLTPYGYTSDMVACSIALVAVVARDGWRIRPWHGLFWLWPGCCHMVAPGFGMILNPVAVTATAAMAWRQLPKPG